MQSTGEEATSSAAGSHALDASALAAWLRASLPPAVWPREVAALHVRQFSHGQSNPTYLLRGESARGAPLAALVLRKKPPGALLASAHAVEREFAVLQALQGSVPVPVVHALCSDAAVLGTPFYVMQHVAGTVFTDVGLAALPEAHRAATYAQLASTLASLHALSPQALGLAAFGGSAGGRSYAARQAARWGQQFGAAAAAAAPPAAEAADMVAVGAWLAANAPASQARTTLVHGDFRLDNCVWEYAPGGPAQPRLLAVLDWELSTLGDPASDLAYLAMPYHLPPRHPAASGAPYPAFAPGGLPPGVPSEAALRALYFSPSPDPFLTPSRPPWAFYVTLSLYRAASILAGVRARAAAGNAAAPNAAAAGRAATMLARCAAQAAGVHSLGPEAPMAPSLTGLGVTPRVAPLLLAVRQFMATHVLPAEAELCAHAVSSERWTVHPTVERLKAAAKAAGLWNLWLPADSAALLRVPGASAGPGLSNAEYCVLAEEMGRCVWASEAFNCAAPDTGNMEVLLRYGTPAQQARWLAPLLAGDIRSCFAMTEPAVASSDATNIAATITRHGDAYTLTGRKWWTSGACDPRCALAIFMGRTASEGPQHSRQSMVLVPMDAPGVTVLRPLTVYGYEDAPHGHAEVDFAGVVVNAQEALLHGEGQGFAIAQGRLGPGRLHHCMRLLGAGARALELARERGAARVAFGKPLAAHGVFTAELGQCRLALEQARLVTHAAAAMLDARGNKAAAGALAMAKLAAPAAALQCLDFAIQAHGAAGVCSDLPLAQLWAGARSLRIADGPDAVHLATLAKLEMAGRARL